MGSAFWLARPYAHAPAGHWCTTTLISSIRLDGSTTCMAVEGATDADVFEVYVQSILLPSLRPYDTVVMDNLSVHKTPRILRQLEQFGARVLFLPAYSPDLNPIEKMWSKVKEFLRTAAARTADALLNAIAAALETVTAEDAAGWFQSCGYSTI